MLKYADAEMTSAIFNGSFFVLSSPANWASIGDAPTRSAVMAWLAEGNTPEPAAPVVTPPISVSPRQIRQALTALGLRARIEEAIAAADQDTKDWYEFATAFEENHAAVLALAAVLGISAEQVHALFVKAAEL